MRRIQRYIAGSFIKAGFPVLVLMLGLFSFLAFVQELDQVGKGTYQSMDALKVLGLTSARRLADLLPVITLLGSVLGLGWMANRRELITIRAVGFSPWQIARAQLSVAFLVVVALSVLQQFAAPVLERQAAQLRAKALTGTDIVGDENQFWSRSKGRFIHVGRVLHGLVPQDIEIYYLNDAGQLTSVYEAKSADVISTKIWMLHGVHRSQIQGSEIIETELPLWRWKSFLSAEQMSVLLASPDTLSTLDLYRYIQELRSSKLSSHRFELIFWQQLGAPLSVLGMALLGIPFVSGSLRSASASQRMMLGSVFGILFYLGEQISVHTALLFDLNPVLSALAPDVGVLAVSLIAVQRTR